MATRLDVINMAFRRAEIKAEDEALTADQIAFAGDVLDSLFAELVDQAGFTWELTDVPTLSLRPLANLLAVEISPDYSVAPKETRGIAWRRFMATVRSDDREDFRDMDDDGTIDADEADIGERARYY